MGAPLAVFRTRIGGETFGIYAYTIKSDDEKVIERGYHICNAAEANSGALGSQDPDINQRIGYSESRDAAVAVAGGTDDSSPLNDEQRAIAKSLVDALRTKLRSSHIKFETKHPNKPTETPFEQQEATSIFLRGYDDKAIQSIAAIVSKTAEELNLLTPWKPKEIKHVPSSIGPHTDKLASKNELTPAEKRLEAICLVLEEHFPGDGHAKARAAAANQLMRDINLGAGQDGRSARNP